MCYVVYLGTDIKLETSAFDEKNPAFYVAELQDSGETAVKQHFTQPNIYYIGSDEGCGCGFSIYEDPDLVNDVEEIELMKVRRTNVKKFCDLVDYILTKSNQCEVFLCWDGDQAVNPDTTQTVTPDVFRNGDWVEDEPTMYKVIEAGAEA